MSWPASAYAGATFLSTMAGGAFAMRYSSWMNRLMAFSGGVLLGAGLLDLLPEALRLDSSTHPGDDATSRVMLWSLSGFVLFYLAERLSVFRSHHSHHHHPEILARASAAPASPLEQDEDAKPAGVERDPHSHFQPVGLLGAAGLCIHSMLDGFSIAVAFRAGQGVGLLVALAVIAHDFTDGVTTVILVMGRGSSRAASVRWLTADALAPLVGVALAATVPFSRAQLGDLLAVFAGMFLYLGATHLLPEAHARSGAPDTALWMVAGLAIMILVTRLLA